MAGRQVRGEKQTHRTVAAQIMMQGGSCAVYSVGQHGLQLQESNRLFARGLVLTSTSAYFLLEGLSKGMPFFFDSASDLAARFHGCAAVAMSFCCDRASPNFAAVAWIWWKLQAPASGVVILPHLEPCALHGVNLIKCRPTGGKKILTALSTLSACMRQWRFASALREAICCHVRANLKVERMPRPSRMRDQAARVLNALFPPDQQDWLYTTDKNGNQIKGQFLEYLNAFHLRWSSGPASTASSIIAGWKLAAKSTSLA